MADALGEFGEGLAAVEIRGVHDVSGSAELLSEGEAPGRQTQRVVKEQEFQSCGRQTNRALL